MSGVDYKERATVTTLRAVTNLAEDTCSEPGCEMTILVDKHDKEQGRGSQCTSCLMRNKIARGEIK